MKYDQHPYAPLHHVSIMYNYKQWLFLECTVQELEQEHSKHDYRNRIHLHNSYNDTNDNDTIYIAKNADSSTLANILRAKQAEHSWVPYQPVRAKHNNTIKANTLRLYDPKHLGRRRRDIDGAT